jgi:hypothetical protein
MRPRPSSLHELAEMTESLSEFGHNLRDWLHEIRRHSSRSELERTVSEEPRELRGRFAEGDVADAWLGAYAEYLARQIDRPPPEWAFHSSRILDNPWFAPEFDTLRLRRLALLHSPLPFKRRNIYTPNVDLPLRLHPGRPTKTAEERKRVNAKRQKRFRIRRKEELKRLREFAAKIGI